MFDWLALTVVVDGAWPHHRVAGLRGLLVVHDAVVVALHLRVVPIICHLVVEIHTLSVERIHNALGASATGSLDSPAVLLNVGGRSLGLIRLLNRDSWMRWRLHLLIILVQVAYV